MYQIYHAEYNPNNLTGVVGGDIGTSLLSGYIGELFYEITSPPSGLDTTEYQYRKVFIRNTHTTTSYYTRVWIDAAEHIEQLSLATPTGLVDSSPTPTDQPTGVSGWTTPENYAEGLSLGTLTVNGYTGLWIRQSLSGITSPDPYATFRLYVGGII